MDALLLARLQFAFTLAYHILFPAFTIGLASFLAVLEILWVVTQRDVFRTLYLFWVKIFAISFGMGVVSGIVMEYQFGTNWSGLVQKAGGVIGPLLAFEVLTAFFLEAGFLGVMLFGWKKVGPGLHLVATCFVALGTLISTFWILAANSWMQSPSGYAVLADGRIVPVSWLHIIFSPSFLPRFLHMGMAAFLTTALVVGCCSAWQLLKRPDQPASRMSLRMAIIMFAIVAPLQIYVGDMSGESVSRLQPAKLAAMEGMWETKGGQAFHVLAWPDRRLQGNRWELSIPKLGSLLVKKDPNAVVTGLKAFKPADQPPVFIVFYAFRIMVALGILMFALGIWGMIRLIRGGPERSKWFLRATVAMGPAGFIAVVCGWIVAEVGRQPYVIYGLLRTADAVSPVGAGQVSASLLAFMIVYAIVFSVGSLYILRLVAQGPLSGDAHELDPPDIPRAPGSALAAIPNHAPGAPIPGRSEPIQKGEQP
jgi:cytochrome d ubiquinol oxidase subunit I